MNRVELKDVRVALRQFYIAQNHPDLKLRPRLLMKAKDKLNEIHLKLENQSSLRLVVDND